MGSRSELLRYEKVLSLDSAERFHRLPQEDSSRSNDRTVFGVVA